MESFMSKKILQYTGMWILLLFFNQHSFSQKGMENTSVKRVMDTATQTSSFNKELDSLSEWKRHRDFAYMNFLDSLLRSQKELRSDTVNIHQTSGKSSWQRDNTNPVVVEFLNSSPVKIFFWALALFFVAFILYKIFLKNSLFAINKRRPITMAEDEVMVLKESAQYDPLISEAESENDFNLSVRYLYLKTIKTLYDKELINYAPDKTNREYLKEMKLHSLANDFFSLTRSYEHIWYGKFLIDAIQYQVLKQQFIQFIKKV